LSIYADSSFFVSLYVRDRHTPQVLRHMASKPAIWMTPFHEAEIANALSQSVFRRLITARQVSLANDNLVEDVRSGLWRQIDFPAAAFQRSVALAHRYGSQIGCRTLDTLHVACALELKAGAFWTFDERQRKLAKAAGLKTS
jgi:predicted nucleic acid-binding protein